jgi:hypothetical protein
MNHTQVNETLTKSEEVVYGAIITTAVNAGYIIVLLLPKIEIYIRVIIALALLISNIFIYVRVIEITHSMQMTIHDLMNEVTQIK